MEKTKQAAEATLHEYYTRQHNSDGVYRRLMARAAGQQQELGQLEKRLDAVRVNVSKVRKERYSLQKEVHKLQVSATPCRRRSTNCR